MTPLSPTTGTYVHPDHADLHAADIIRIAHSRINHCVLSVAQGCALRITDLLSRTHGPLSQDDIRSCIAAQHSDIDADALRFPTCNDSIAHVLSQTGVADVLPADVLDTYRATYQTELLRKIRTILPIYRPVPGRSADMHHAGKTLSDILPPDEEKDGWQGPALVA